VLPPWVTLDAALGWALNDIKWSPWTYELLRAMFAEVQERGDHLSSSALVAHCPRAEVIKRKESYVADLKDLYIPFRGTMVHRTLEHAASEDAIAEARFYTNLDGIEFSCSPDLLTRTTLYDYKVTETPPAYDYPYVSHKEQVQFNAYIVRHADEYSPAGETEKFPVSFAVEGESLPFDPREHPVEHVALVYMGPKFVKTLEVEKTDDVFNEKTGKFSRRKIPYVWSDKLVERELKPRLFLLKEALDIYPKWPEGAELVWGGEPGWLCPGPPLCRLPDCLAKRWPNRLSWEVDGIDPQG
jgi:hypothetical protein